MSKKDKKESEQIEVNTEDMSDEELKKYVTKEAKKDMLLDIGPYLIIIFFVVLIRTFIASPVRVNGSSMYPTLNEGDNMILYKLAKHTRGIKRFDIAVIKTDKDRLIKRVIGLPGETVKYEIIEEDEGKKVAHLYINDKIIEEEFISDEAKAETCKLETSPLCSEEGYLVPEGEYFVMGDNRGDSLDSRIIGSVEFEKIQGITSVIIFPFNRMGSVK